MIDVKTAVQTARGYFEQSIAGLTGRDRAYKTITIDTEIGEFRSMKIRPLPVPA
jgi:hypothetical protein